ncbi:MAG: hypothetical protein GY822_23920 [Deltaproteobacteria bacterium]|nr:hypothetical protein [Deltaproteobacteria bacterium]
MDGPLHVIVEPGEQTYTLSCTGFDGVPVTSSKSVAGGGFAAEPTH